MHFFVMSLLGLSKVSGFKIGWKIIIFNGLLLLLMSTPQVQGLANFVNDMCGIPELGINNDNKRNNKPLLITQQTLY